MEQTKELRIRQREVYGRVRFYPECPLSRTFAALCGTKTLTKGNLDNIMLLGYSIKHVLSFETEEERSDGL
jgi:hypothetical protein